MNINTKLLSKVLADISAAEKKKNSNSPYLSRFIHRCMDGSTLGNGIIQCINIAEEKNYIIISNTEKMFIKIHHTILIKFISQNRT